MLTYKRNDWMGLHYYVVVHSVYIICIGIQSHKKHFYHENAMKKDKCMVVHLLHNI